METEAKRGGHEEVSEVHTCVRTLCYKMLHVEKELSHHISSLSTPYFIALFNFVFSFVKGSDRGHVETRERRPGQSQGALLGYASTDGQSGI